MIRILFLFTIFPIVVFSQDDLRNENSKNNFVIVDSVSISKKYYIDLNYTYGNIVKHSNKVKHLIVGHPDGFFISFNRMTFGDQDWQSRYNYPDYGASFSYLDMHNEVLGKNYGLYGHYNFYFLRRKLILRVAQGITYNTNPYDKETNFQNVAYGSHFFPSTYFLLNYHKLNIYKGIGIQVGALFIHHSNANMKAPNTSTNALTFNVGLNYELNYKETINYLPIKDTLKVIEPIRYNIIFRGGINQNDLIGSGQFPFFVLSAYADKRLSYKSSIQAGADLFDMRSIREYARYREHAYPSERINANADYRKIGVFIGHELFINKLSMETQFGYYIYAPLNFMGSFYQRIGLKYYVSKPFFAGIGLKTHSASAEALEFSLGIRF